MYGGFVPSFSERGMTVCIHVLPRQLWLQTTPPCRGGLQSRHVSRDPGPHLLAEVSSGAATCFSAPDLASPAEVGSGAATCPMALGSASPRGELRRCHVFLSSGPRLPAEVGSGTATWPWPHLPERRATVLSRTPRSQRAVDHMNKEMPSCPRHMAGLACVQSTVACYRGTCKVCKHAATVRFNSTTHAQLTTYEHSYSGDTTRHDSTTALTMFSIAG
jgi:hypothetical protein